MKRAPFKLCLFPWICKTTAIVFMSSFGLTSFAEELAARVEEDQPVVEALQAPEVLVEVLENFQDSNLIETNPQTNSPIEEGTVTESVELFEDLLSTEQAVSESVDESFLHFQAIHDLIEIKNTNIRTVNQQNTFTTALGQGLTPEGRECSLERNQEKLHQNQLNPYAQNINFLVRVSDGEAMPVRGLVSLDEEDLNFRVKKFEKTDSHWLISIERKQTPLGSELKAESTQVEIDFEQQLIKNIRIQTQMSTGDQTLKAQSDVQCLNIVDPATQQRETL